MTKVLNKCFLIINLALWLAQGLSVRLTVVTEQKSHSVFVLFKASLDTWKNIWIESLEIKRCLLNRFFWTLIKNRKHNMVRTPKQWFLQKMLHSQCSTSWAHLSTLGFCRDFNKFNSAFCRYIHLFIAEADYENAYSCRRMITMRMT